LQADSDKEAAFYQKIILNTNMTTEQLKELKARVAALRGYL